MFSNFDPILSGNPVVKLEMSNAETQYIQLYPFSTQNTSLVREKKLNITGESESLQYLHPYSDCHFGELPHSKVHLHINFFIILQFLNIKISAVFSLCTLWQLTHCFSVF